MKQDLYNKMRTKKIHFKNRNAQKLTAYLDLPIDRKATNFVLFAHCFTCTKNLTSVRNISKTLSNQGYGVFSFDFTGLGQSEGDFSETDFSGNVEDLIDAANFLEKDYQAPSLLVGHSLGGAAVLLAAKTIKSVKAVATIAAPSNPVHVKKLLQDDIQEIEKNGFATVKLAGRPFTIKKEFLDDIEKQQVESNLKGLKIAYLNLHSPQDTLVGISNAESLYKNAHHPKSFISLDGADHLLSNKKDAIYVGESIAAWAKRYLEFPEDEKLETKEDAVASLHADNGFTTNMRAGDHPLTADEPIKVGGNNFGPNPFELVSAGLSACTVMTLQMYARHKKWDLQKVETHTSHHQEKEETEVDGKKKIVKHDIFKRKIMMEGDLDEKQRKRLIEIANKCPVHNTLAKKAKIDTVAVE